MSKKQASSILQRQSSPSNGENRLYQRIQEILESARSSIARTFKSTQVVANWLMGRELYLGFFSTITECCSPGLSSGFRGARSGFLDPNPILAIFSHMLPHGISSIIVGGCNLLLVLS